MWNLSFIKSLYIKQYILCHRHDQDGLPSPEVWFCAVERSSTDTPSPPRKSLALFEFSMILGQPEKTKLHSNKWWLEIIRGMSCYTGSETQIHYGLWGHPLPFETFKL